MLLLYDCNHNLYYNYSIPLDQCGASSILMVSKRAHCLSFGSQWIIAMAHLSMRSTLVRYVVGIMYCVH